MESQHKITFIELIEMPLFNILQRMKSINQTNDFASTSIHPYISQAQALIVFRAKKASSTQQPNENVYHC